MSEAHTESGTPLTTKGDIYGFSTIPARLAVGSDAQVVVADSSTSTGLAWADTTRTVALASDQTFADDTLTNITNLAFTMAASTTYFVEGFLQLNSTAANTDFQFLWTFPAAATMNWDFIGAPLGGGSQYQSSWHAHLVAGTPVVFSVITATVSVGGVIGTNGVILFGIAVNSTTAGSLQLQAAKNINNAGTTKILAGSFLRFRKLQ